MFSIVMQAQFGNFLFAANKQSCQQYGFTRGTVCHS